MEQHNQFKKLQEENLKLKAELAVFKTGKKTRHSFNKFITKHSTNFFAGKGLKKSLRKLFEELPNNVTKETMAEVSSHLIWRITRVGSFAIMLAAVPILILSIQTFILKIQNDKIHVQNELIQAQNRRLDQQINLEEGNRRSSFIFLMSNIMDKVDEELKARKNKSRNLSDELIGRIVSLSQILRPYRYLENDTLTERQLSPERGQLLFALVNSLLHEETLDKIYEKADFSYADLQNANFSGTYLRRAKLVHAALPNADFSNAYLEEVNFENALLIGANFENAAMPSANFREANLAQATLVGVTMTNAQLNNANLQECYISGNFSKAIIDGVDLEKAEIGITNLEGVQVFSEFYQERLRNFNMIGVDFIFDNFEWKMLEVANSHGSGQTFQLTRKTASELSMSEECHKAVRQMVESTQKIRSLKKECSRKGKAVECYIEASPFGGSFEGVLTDSVYHFRFIEEGQDIFKPLIIVEFNPTEGQLFELDYHQDSISKSPLYLSNAMLSQLNMNCWEKN